MSFSFTGLIANHVIKSSQYWDSSCRFFEFTDPFVGTLIRITGPLSEGAGISLKTAALSWTKAHPSIRLLVIEYDTWAGRIDRCVGYVMQDGKAGTARQGEDENAEEIFAELFAELGKPLVAGFFAPFVSLERS
jgi:hypothetical protein